MAPSRRQSRFGRFFVARRRLLLAILAGLVLVLVLPASHRLATRFLLAWDLTAVDLCRLRLLMISRSTVETCRARAALYDESDWVIVTSWSWRARRRASPRSSPSWRRSSRARRRPRSAWS